MIQADFHIHSKYSIDSLMKPHTILKTAKQKGLNIIAVTDHETIRGGIETYKLQEHMRLNDVKVVVGEEISTDMGDIVGLFLRKDIQSKIINEVIDEIHSQSGIVLLPHPFKGHEFSILKNILEKVDIVELLNSRAPITREQINIIKGMKKPMVGCSDAHFPCEIGLCRTMISSYSLTSTSILSKESNLIVRGEYSPIDFEPYSQLIRALRLKNLKEMLLDVPFLFLRNRFAEIEHI